MSKREDVLNALFERLSALKDVIVKRNETLPQIIPQNGLVILRDGVVGEPEVLLSPPCVIFRHKAEVEILVQHPSPSERDLRLDFLLENIGRLLLVDPTLSGTIDYMVADPPEFVEELIEGAPTIKAAIVQVLLEYASETSLT